MTEQLRLKHSVVFMGVSLFIAGVGYGLYEISMVVGGLATPLLEGAAIFLTLIAMFPMFFAAGGILGEIAYWAPSPLANEGDNHREAP